MATPKSSSAQLYGFRFPMLATALAVATKGVERLPTGTWIAEKKEDGHRLIVAVGDFGVIGWSRTGLDTRESNRPLPKHVVEACKKLPHGVYDGELVVPGGTSSDVADLLNQSKLVYVIFDVLQLSFEGLGVTDLVSTKLKERRAALEEIFASLDPSVSTVFAQQGFPLQLSRTWPVTSWEQAFEIVGTIWDEGGEGIILKDVNAPYQCGKRTKTFLKLKGLHPLETTVIGFVPTSGEIMNRGNFATAVVQDEEGITTIVKTLDDDEIERLTRVFQHNARPPQFVKHHLSAGRNVDMITNHPDVGRKLHCEYTERTTDGLYRHIRWDRWEDQ